MLGCQDATKYWADWMKGGFYLSVLRSGLTLGRVFGACYPITEHSINSDYCTSIRTAELKI